MIQNNLPQQNQHLEQYSIAERSPCYESCIKCCGNCQGQCMAWVCCGSGGGFQLIQESHLGIVLEFGRYVKTLPSGQHFVNPMSETLVQVDRREKVIDLKKQAVMTKDNVNITIDAVVYYHIEDPYKALFAVENVELAIAEIAKTTVRDVFGHVLLQEALETKEKMAAHIKEIIEKPTYNWGTTITRVLIQEIIFSKELQSNLSAAATAKRMAEGKIINAQADVDSAKLMREASDILNTPAAMQIRYLDALTSLAKANNTKIIFMPNESAK